MSDPGAGSDELMTERLVLRRLRESDLDALAAIYADPAVMRFSAARAPVTTRAPGSAG